MGPPSSAPSARPRGRTKTVVATALVVCIAIVAFQNWRDAQVELLFVTVTMPLLVLIAISFGAGLLVGGLLRRRRKA